MSEFSALKIIVLAGGISHERDVSLRSGRRIADALTDEGHFVTVLDPGANLLGTLAEQVPDLIWPTLHGATGEDGALLSLLETTGLPFLGSRGPAAALAWNKAIAKELVLRAGFATPPAIALSTETFRDLGAASVLEHLVSAIGLPLVVKPAQGGSSQGVTIVRTPADLPRAMVDAYTYADTALVEAYIDGTEVTVAVLDTGDGPTALPIVEIVPLDGVYSFEARYNAGETDFYTPARLSDDISVTVATAAVAIHTLLGLRHLSRIDLIVDAAGTPWFLEANVLPGLTETSLVPQAIEADRRTLGATYSALAVNALATQ
ncbi:MULTISPECIES: D-alanine--D-alanine ligase family protein [Cryobacterium]|jgi:D-alanine-D-alanine ligase|uniref:D-alanine--D-alanine ligase n=1 Tax=Cryobacterium lyxosi TaxID=1259228 RepID=A0A4R8ZI45_9MICO|nr:MULTISPECIES: D-alanine--D-alanine ligase [Cryobacterium]TFD28686.1 D-alanine--D-alanine ligase [Cryobacterium lyxosi]